MDRMTAEQARTLFRPAFEGLGLPKGLPERILATGRTMHVPAGQALHHVGDEPGGLWGLAQGALAVETATGAREPATNFLLHPVSWVGEGSLATGQGRLVGLATTRDSVLLHLSQSGFLEIARTDPMIWRWLCAVQHANLVRAIALSEALMTRNSRARVAIVLYQLCAGHPRELDLAQADLGGIANLSRSLLNPILKEFAAAGTLRLHRNRIVILDAEALLALTG